MELAHLYQREWDYLIIGTGMGGATLGYALAKAGKSVLFCERGKSLLKEDGVLRGDFAESYFPQAESPQAKHQDILLRAGRYCDEILDVTSPRPRSFIPFIGTGTGGSTALYGMALERLSPADFTPKANYPEATDSTLPKTWPIIYEELLPYYEEAERLYRVRDAQSKTDSALAGPALSPAAREFHDFFRDQGLHSYPLPKACEYVADCQTCQGYLCPKNCKNDSGRICLEPALRDFDAHLLDECEVVKLEATRESITGVVANHRGQSITLRAAIVVLAAGALETPRLLLNSASSVWPNGLANDSGLVGKNLMRHYVDLYVVAPHSTMLTPSHKELAFNDLYTTPQHKFGAVQSFGSLPPAPIVIAEMEHDLRTGALRWLTPLFKMAKPAFIWFLGRLFARRLIFASIMEDLPYEDNQVMLPDKGGKHGNCRLLLRYHIRDRERERIREFREKIQEIFHPYRYLLFKQAENNQRIAHACGTCRFGHDPADSVLNSTNQAHGLTNLYVVDGSFFPSSGGTNPALTIAANALRVADHLLGKRKITNVQAF